MGFLVAISLEQDQNSHTRAPTEVEHMKMDTKF